jgi:DNA-binding IclR family transcriptional regulator
MLTALERAGLLERDASGSYVAGRLFWLYAARHDPWAELVRLARPTMDAIGEQTGETVNLSVTRGDRVVQVAQIDSRFMLGTRDWTEVDVPAHCSSLGKVFYAFDVLQNPARVPSRATTPRPWPTTRSCGSSEADPRPRLGHTPPTSSRSASPVVAWSRWSGGRAEVIAALGISGPTPATRGPARRARP